MLVGLIRHGLTDWNAAGRIQGQSDIPLNDVGRNQARKLALRLMEERTYRWDGVITSGLLRAQETGVIIAEHLNLPLLEPDPRLMERSYGQVEGLTALERESKWGKNWNQQDLGQEKDLLVQERALSFMSDLAGKYSDQNILVISHGGLLAQLYTALYRDAYNERIVNLSLSIVQRSQERWNMLLYNCSRHLMELVEESS